MSMHFTGWYNTDDVLVLSVRDYGAQRQAMAQGVPGSSVVISRA